jgi:hypothetical protein
LIKFEHRQLNILTQNYDTNFFISYLNKGKSELNAKLVNNWTTWYQNAAMCSPQQGVSRLLHFISQDDVPINDGGKCLGGNSWA